MNAANGNTPTGDARKALMSYKIGRALYFVALFGGLIGGWITLWGVVF